MEEPSPYFFELFDGLPRGGPGDNASTRSAWRAMMGVPPSPAILDVGCGPGMQTLELARLSRGRITALDIRQPFLNRLERDAARLGLSEHIITVNRSMSEMDFPPESFDVIWSEGAIFFLGFENGLKTFRVFLKRGGHIAVTEAVWLKPDPPGEVRKLWRAYPALTTIKENLEMIARTGLRMVTHFVLPARSWVDDYYDPMEKRIAELKRTHAGNAEALETLAACQHEIDVFRNYPGYYGYAFFVMERTREELQYEDLVKIYIDYMKSEPLEIWPLPGEPAC
jgi:ubiquinone/menaquinone biosynthesis C-methylase UbiE